MPCFPTQIVQIAMSLRDTTTDENELAMGYTVPQERLRRGRSSTWCYEPATNLIGDEGKHVEKDLFQKTSSSLPV